jgi:cytidine deaminase
MPPSELTGEDIELVAAARAALEAHYKPFWHTVSAAMRLEDGRIVTGLHLGATVGRMAVCAEAVALGRAVMEGGGAKVVTAVAMRHPKPGESGDIKVVPPCGGCREMMADHAPDAVVIVPTADGLARMPVAALLPLPYQR